MRRVATRETDVLVIGGGGAGCRAAIESASSGCRVLLASKLPVGRSGATVVAESYYAAPLGRSDPQDSPEHYFHDTVQAGCLLCEQALARRLARDGCDRVTDLIRYGVKFRSKEDGELIQLKGPGHRYARALAPVGGGLGIMKGLQKELARYPQVELLEDVVITKILTCEGMVQGAMGLDVREGTPIVIESKAVILATGGYSRLWSYNDVPCDCTGDGIAMAFHAGADLIDMEMILFYPTVLIHPPFLYGIELPHGLLLEQIQAKLLNGRFEEFVPERLPTRDVMVSLIYKELVNGKGTPHGGVFLDAGRSSLSRGEVRKRLMTYLPEKYGFLLKYGIDLAREPLEVAPMAHYTLGGVRINPECQTRIGGLYAAGEVEANVHGANRLAGNALPETQVFGANAGESAAHWVRERDRVECDAQEVVEEAERIESFLEAKTNPTSPIQLKAKVQDLMWRHVGIERRKEGLQEAMETIAKMKHQELPRLAVPPIREFNLQWIEALEVSHMLDLSELIARAALMREETRGHHFRLDFPERDDGSWRKHIVIRKKGGKMKLWTEPANENGA